MAAFGRALRCCKIRRHIPPMQTQSRKRGSGACSRLLQRCKHVPSCATCLLSGNPATIQQEHTGWHQAPLRQSVSSSKPRPVKVPGSLESRLRPVPATSVACCVPSLLALRLLECEHAKMSAPSDRAMLSHERTMCLYISCGTSRVADGPGSDRGLTDSSSSQQWDLRSSRAALGSRAAVRIQQWVCSLEMYVYRGHVTECI